MKHTRLLLLLAAAFIFSACAANQTNGEDPVIAKERKKNEKWEKQTSKEMFASRNIPSVEFEFDSFRLKTSAYETLDKVAEFMVPNPKIKLIVEGHTDNIGSHEYNDWLSHARAMSVKNYLVSRGVYPDSIKIYGYGKRRPLTMDTSPAGRQTNRRITFVITTRRWQAIY